MGEPSPEKQDTARQHENQPSAQKFDFHPDISDIEDSNEIVWKKIDKTPTGRSDLKSADEMQKRLDIQESGVWDKPISKEIDTPVNLAFLQFYCFVLGLGVFQTSMSFAGTTQTIPIIAAQFSWSDEDVKFYNTIITSAGIFGLSMGSLLGGKTITIGRRKAALIMQLIAFVGAVCTQYLHVSTLCIGRLLYGFAAGHLNIVMAKSIAETVPAKVQGQFGIFTNAYLRIGIMLLFFLGAILPDDVEQMKQDQRWRIIYAVPLLTATLQVLFFLFVIKEEPIGFCISLDRKEEARSLLKRVYLQGKLSDEEFDNKIDEQLRYLGRSTSKESSFIKFNQAVCGPTYRKATWVCCILNVFNQQSGIGILTVYATRLLILIHQQTNDQFPISPLVGTILIGIGCAVFAILGAFVVKVVGRRKILIIGSLAMAICMLVMGLGIKYEWFLTSYCFMILFIIAFNLSTGNVAFIYCAEVTVDQAAGITMFHFFASLCVFAFTAEYMMGSFLQVPGTFWVFAFLNFLGFLFCLVFIEETMGLTDKQKKSLYSPAKIDQDDDGIEMTQWPDEPAKPNDVK